MPRLVLTAHRSLINLVLKLEVKSLKLESVISPTYKMADESDLSTKIVIVPGSHGIACESDIWLRPKRVSYPWCGMIVKHLLVK